MENKMSENPRDEEGELLDFVSELFSFKSILIAMLITILGFVYIAYEIHAINTGSFSISELFIGWLFDLVDVVREWMFNE